MLANHFEYGKLWQPMATAFEALELPPSAPGRFRRINAALGALASRGGAGACEVGRALPMGNAVLENPNDSDASVR